MKSWILMAFLWLENSQNDLPAHRRFSNTGLVSGCSWESCFKTVQLSPSKCKCKEHLIHLKLQGKLRKANAIMQIGQLPRMELTNIFNFTKRIFIYKSPSAPGEIMTPLGANVKGCFYGKSVIYKYKCWCQETYSICCQTDNYTAYN